MKTLDELHKAYMKDKETNEDYDYENEKTQNNDNEFTVLNTIKMIKNRSR